MSTGLDPPAILLATIRTGAPTAAGADAVVEPARSVTDILLIQPPIQDFYLTAKRTIPYGLACIATSLIETGFSVEILDGLATPKRRRRPLPPELDHLTACYPFPDRSPFGLFSGYFHFGYSLEHIGRVTRDSGAFLVGISALFTAYSDMALSVARGVKKWLPRAVTVLGGHHPTALPEAVMASPHVDFVIRGEGEAALPLLARAIRSGEPLSSVPGIVFRQERGGLHISPPAVLKTADRIPLPAAHLIDPTYYRVRGRRSAVVVTSRGCPMSCSYCCVGAAGPPYRRRSLESVLTEIETAVEKNGAGFIDFEDENISLNREWFQKLLLEIRRRFSGNGLELRAMNGLFPPSLDRGLIRNMKEAGFKALNLALCTTAPAQLRRFRRPDVRQAITDAVQSAQEIGMETVCYIIAGGPGQHARDTVADILFLARLNTLVGLSIFYPAPGSPDYNLLQRKNRLPNDFSLFRATALPVCTPVTRTDAVTLLRLTRIVNFIKHLRDTGHALPQPAPLETALPRLTDSRDTLGRKLLAAFLYDGRIWGMDPDGRCRPHLTAPSLVADFMEKAALFLI